MAITPREHDELRQQASLYVLGALTAEERTLFEAHLTACTECAEEARAFAAVPDALARAVPQIDPPPALRERVVRAVGGSGTGAPHASSTIAGDARAPISQGRRSSLAPWLAAAAGVLLAVGLGANTLRLQTRIGDLETRLRNAILRADASEGQIAEARRAVADAETRVTLLAAPDLTRVDLAGQPVAPQAAGRAYWSRSRGLMFTASDLPALGPGRVYQLWILAGNDPPISNRWLLRPDAAGRVAVLFDTPADLPAPSGVAISIEPEGGVPAPTGALYLVGLIRRS
jgi:anti-sigma-K factor RskA